MIVADVSPAIATPMRRPHRRPLLESRTLFILPAVLMALVFTIFPTLFSMAMVFMKLDLISYQFGFNGVANIIRLIGDPAILAAVLVTLHFVVLVLPCEYLLGLGLALLLNQEGLRGVSFFRTYFLLPMMLSPVAISYDIGKMLFDENRGPVNQMLRALHLGGVHWLSDPGIALDPMVIIDVWQWTPFMMILLLSGLQSIPDDIYDAARVDGASLWQSFRHVTFPLLAPVTMTAILIRGIEATKIFETIFVVTGGGPGTVTESLTLHVYQVGFKNLDLGYAATISLVLLFIIVIGATIYLAIWRRFMPETTST
jgi:multiple sugar transport system permease protein